MMRVRLPSHAENRLKELQAIERPLSRDERRDLSLYRKLVRQQRERRERYANDPEFRRREIERCTRYWRENRG